MHYVLHFFVEIELGDGKGMRHALRIVLAEYQRRRFIYLVNALVNFSIVAGRLGGLLIVVYLDYLSRLELGVTISVWRFSVFRFYARHNLPRALYSVGEHYSTRADEGRKCCTLLEIKTKWRTVAGRGEKSLLSDPGSELRLEREKGTEKLRRE